MEAKNNEQIKLLLLHCHKIQFNYALREGNSFKISNTYEIKQNINKEFGTFPKGIYMFIQCTECEQDLFSKNNENIMLFRTKNNKEWVVNKFNNNFVLMEVISQANPKINLYNNSTHNNFRRDKFYKIQKESEGDDFLLIGTLQEIKQYYKKNYQELKKRNSDLKLIIEPEKDKNINEAYDIVISIKSMVGLKKGGWEIKYPKGKDQYNEKSKKKAIIAGVIGNGNKGKSFILGKLTGYQVPQGFTINTEGLSIRYGDRADHCIAILDSAGQETPLLNDGLKHSDSLNQSSNAEEKQKNELEAKLRDKLITEAFIQQFIIDTSHILILVVGAITLNEQKLLERVKKIIAKDKYLYVIHNLQNYSTKNQVNGYINNTLNKLFGLNLHQNIYQENQGDFYKYYFVEANDKIAHLILVNDYSKEISKYYNYPAIKFLQGKLYGEQRRIEFSVIEKCKEFLLKIQTDFMEKLISKNDFVEEIQDKIILKKEKEDIKLKRVFIDEIGKTITNYSDELNYFYYINNNGQTFNICIENPGEGAEIEGKNIIPGPEYFTFEFNASKPGIKDNFENNKLNKNIKKDSKITFNIHVPRENIYFTQNNEKKLNYFEKTNKDGIFTFKYNFIELDN